MSLLLDTDGVLAAVSNLFLFAIVGLIRDPSTAGAGPTTTTQTLTTSTRGTPSSTKRLSVSMANTQERSNRTWRGARLCRTSGHLCIRRFTLDFIHSSVQIRSENLSHTGIIFFYFYHSNSKLGQGFKIPCVYIIPGVALYRTKH